MDCVVTPLKTLMGFSVHLNVQLKFYNLPNHKMLSPIIKMTQISTNLEDLLKNTIKMMTRIMNNT